MNTTITATPAAQAETFWVVRDRIRLLGEVPGSELSLLEVEVPPGSGTPPHRHASPEMFRVLSGELTFGLFDQLPPRELVAGPGDVVRVPAHAPHNYRNAGQTPASMLVIVDRSMVAFFRDLGRHEAPAGGPPTEAEIASILAACSRHGIAVLPPTP